MGTPLKRSFCAATFYFRLVSPFMQRAYSIVCILHGHIFWLEHFPTQTFRQYLIELTTSCLGGLRLLLVCCIHIKSKKFPTRISSAFAIDMGMDIDMNMANRISMVA